MLFNIINYSGVIIGQVEASDAIEAWKEAGRKYESILDVREVCTIKVNDFMKKAARRLLP